MPKLYDTTFREMFSKGLHALLPWLLPGATACEVLKEDKALATTTRWPDLVLRVSDGGLRRVRAANAGGQRRKGAVIQIFECQCQDDPELPVSMLTRAVLAHDLHRLPVRTTVLALAPAAVPLSSYAYGEGEGGEVLRHSVTVRRVFEESADEAMQRDIAELLPLVTVMQPRRGDRGALVRRVVDRIVERVAGSDQRKMLVEQAANFATLRLSRPQVHDIVQDVLRRRRIMIDPLRDFPLVRDGYRKGVREGMARGELRGTVQNLLTMLEARGLQVSPSMRKKIMACTDRATLDRWFKNAIHASSIDEVTA